MNERRIATVLRVRSLRERIARGAVAEHRRHFDERRREEDVAWATVHARGQDAPRGPHQFVGHRTMLRAGVTEAVSAGERVDVAAREVSSAISHWQDEARRLDGIERLAERILLEVQAEERRRDGKELDDLVVMRRGPAAPAVGHIGTGGEVA